MGVNTSLRNDLSCRGWKSRRSSTAVTQFWQSPWKRPRRKRWRRGSGCSPTRTRLRLLSLIANAPDGEMCACDVTAPVGRSQPTVSHHLSILTDAGLLAREQRGKWAWFRVVPERLSVLRDALTTA